MTRLEVMDDALKVVGLLEDARDTQSHCFNRENEAKVSMEYWKAVAEQSAINAGQITGKTVGERDRELAIIIEDNDQYKAFREGWLKDALARHAADARVEAIKYQLDIYKAYLGGNND